MKYLIYCLLFCFACSPSSDNNTNAVFRLDDSGAELKLIDKPQRVISVSPSLTELLSLIVDSSLVKATSIYCNYPESWASKMKINPYPLDIETSVRLKPDLILAKRDLLNASEIQRCRELSLPLFLIKFDSVEHIFTATLKLGDLLGRQERAREVHDSLKTEWDKLKSEKLKTTTCIVLISSDLFAFGKSSYVTELLAVNGGENVIESNQAFPQLSRESILRSDPEVLIAPDGLDWDNFFVLYPELKKTKAFRTKRLYKMSGDFLSRPGPRFIETCKQFRKIFTTQTN